MEAVVETFERRREELRARAPQTRARLGAIGRLEPAGRGAGRRPPRRGGAGAARRQPTSSAAASAARPSSRPPRRSSCCSPAASARSSRGRSTRCWPAASTTSSAAASPATRSTPPGSSPTSRRCSTTTPCSPAPTCTAGRRSGHERYRRVCEETLDWVLREMRGPEGGFYSALDADSEGEEGRFYVWTPARDPRGPGRAAPARRSSSTASPRRGNFEGRNVLHLAGGAAAPRAGRPRRGPSSPPRGPREARPARPRRQAPHRLERARC